MGFWQKNDKKMTLDHDLSDIEDLIKDTFGTFIVVHKLIQRSTGVCHIFDNHEAVYAAGHIGKGIGMAIDEWDYVCAIATLKKYNGQIVVAQFIDDKQHKIPVVDSEYIQKQGNAHNAAASFYAAFEEGVKYLILVRIPITTSVQEAEKKAANIAALVTHDWGIEQDNNECKDPKYGKPQTPEITSEPRSA